MPFYIFLSIWNTKQGPLSLNEIYARFSLSYIDDRKHGVMRQFAFLCSHTMSWLYKLVLAVPPFQWCSENIHTFIGMGVFPVSLISTPHIDGLVQERRIVSRGKMEHGGKMEHRVFWKKHARRGSIFKSTWFLSSASSAACMKIKLAIDHVFSISHKRNFTLLIYEFTRVLTSSALTH